MMATQSYYGGGGNYDTYHRPLHRSQSTAGYHDRATPYGCYDQPRQELRADYDGRQSTRTIIHEPELEIGNVGSRRRIAVACSRCRRRKIKCSGDPLDGSGCQACRASGTDVNACTFDRVGSATVPFNTGVEAYPPASSAGSISAGGAYGSEVASTPGWHQGHYLHSRPSLPTLHTRSSWMDNYDGYENSPVDAYTYTSAFPRQDSYASSYGSLENYRSWSTAGPQSAPISASFYEQQPAYSFGTMQTPTYTAAPSNRLPSVTGDMRSPLNMGSLHSSLPIQTAQERQLPVPYTIRYPTTTYPTPHIPPVRPLGSYSEPRAPTHGIHSRTAMPWSDSIPTRTTTATASNYHASSCGPVGCPPSSYRQYDGLRYEQPIQRQQVSVAPTPEPVLGYQFNNAANHTQKTSSPNISPTSGPGLTESFSSTTSNHNGTISVSMAPPPSTFRYTSVMPAASTVEDQPSTSTSCEATAASLYSFSTDSSNEQQQRAANAEDENDEHAAAGDEYTSSNVTDAGVHDGYSYDSSIAQQHAHHHDNSSELHSTSHNQLRPMQQYGEDSGAHQHISYASLSRHPNHHGENSNGGAEQQASYAQLRPPSQQLGSSSVGSVRRQSSFHRHQRANTVQRMSVSNLSRQY
ncbi:hypothetical protein LTR97_008228 [Elasticomyces elasticus]|uniref:Zn(2)-C6 fungal-type domain-containing protein n=1 Tax=Elasticomyces elasticus TaxID=574655 RepID=A0AAN7ZSJ7_9PEZI|nr:hypothetical protein LTR97_008228 [Elasticomyces elasticus]